MKTRNCGSKTPFAQISTRSQEISEPIKIIDDRQLSKYLSHPIEEVFGKKFRMAILSFNQISQIEFCIQTLKLGLYLRISSTSKCKQTF